MRRALGTRSPDVQPFLASLEAREVRSYVELLAAVDSMVRGEVGEAVVTRAFPISETIEISPLSNLVTIRAAGRGALFAGLGVTAPLFRVFASGDAPTRLPAPGVVFDRVPMFASGGCVDGDGASYVELHRCKTGGGRLFTGDSQRLRVEGCALSLMSAEVEEAHVIGNRGGAITLTQKSADTVVVVTGNVATAGTSPNLDISGITTGTVAEANNPGYTVVT